MKITEPQRNETALHKKIVKVYARLMCLHFPENIKKIRIYRLRPNLNQLLKNIAITS